jgi:flagellar biosynthetic protein FlhB
VDAGRRRRQQAVRPRWSAACTLDREQITNPNVLIERIAADIAGVMLACLPLALAIMLVAIVSPLLIGGWNFSAKSFMPNFGKLNPMNGLGNMVSTMPWSSC